MGNPLSPVNRLHCFVQCKNTEVPLWQSAHGSPFVYCDFPCFRFSKPDSFKRHFFFSSMLLLSVSVRIITVTNRTWSTYDTFFVSEF